MSDKEKHRRRVCKAVLNEAWRVFIRTGRLIYKFSLCLKLAWKTIRSKLRLIYSKVRGVTFDNRQELLYRLAKYPASDVLLSFIREPDNPVDSNAVAIAATVVGKGTAKIGYLSKELAVEVAPILDIGKDAVVVFEGITGTSKLQLGCNLCFAII